MSTGTFAGGAGGEAGTAAAFRSAGDRVVRDALPGLATGLAALQAVLALVHLQGSPAERPLAVVDAVSALCGLMLRTALGRHTLPERWAHPVAAGFVALAILIVLLHLRILGDPLQGLMLIIVMIGSGSILMSRTWFVPVVAAALLGWLAVIASLGFPQGARRVSIALVGSAFAGAMVLAARRRTFLRLESSHQDLQRAFASLRESEDSHRLLFDLGPLPAWVFDRASLRFLAVNDAAVRHYGYSRAEFLGMTLAEMRPPDEIPGTHEHLKKDGTRIEVEILAHDLRLGGYFAVLAILTDVTERKRAEKALRRSRESFQQLFDEAPIGMAMVGSSLRFERVNRALCEMVGYSREEVAEIPFEEMIAPPDVAAHLAFVQEFVEGKRSGLQIEARYLRKGGTSFWGRLTVETIEDSTGAMLFVLVIVEDISERRRAADERERMIAELQEALATVKTLRGLIPICAWCKKVRDDKGYWSQVETFIQDHSDAEFSHGICPDCKKSFGAR